MDIKTVVYVVMDGPHPVGVYETYLEAWNRHFRERHTIITAVFHADPVIALPYEEEQEDDQLPV